MLPFGTLLNARGFLQSTTSVTHWSHRRIIGAFQVVREQSMFLYRWQAEARANWCFQAALAHTPSWQQHASRWRSSIARPPLQPSGKRRYLPNSLTCSREDIALNDSASNGCRRQRFYQILPRVRQFSYRKICSRIRQKRFVANNTEITELINWV